MRALKFPAALATLVCGCASIGNTAPPTNALALYGNAYGWGRVAFRCYPTSYRGTPHHVRDQRLEKTLHARLQRVRARLVRRLGEEAVYDTELESDRAEESVYRTGCDLNENAHAQREYRRFLRELEVRIIPRHGPVRTVRLSEKH
jgi:hypothetical protein